MSILNRFLVIAIIAIINIFLFETFARMIVVHAKPFLGKTATFDQKFQIATRKENSSAQILLMGDSIMHFGVYPELLDVQLNSQMKSTLYSLNLASPSATPKMNLLLLKQIVKQSGPPRLVIYNFSPRVFNRNRTPDHYDTTKFESSYFNRCFNQKNHDFSNQFRCFFEKNLALVRYRNFLRDEAKKIPRTLFSFEKRLKFNADSSPEREISEQGWAPSYPVRSLKTLTKHYYHSAKVESIFRNELGNYEWSTETIQPFLSYCKEQNIPILIVWLPEHHLIKQYYSQIGLSPKKLETRLTELANGKTIYFLNLDDEHDVDGEFSDLDHLTPLGTIRLTSDLAKRLQEQPYQALLQPEVRS